MVDQSVHHPVVLRTRPRSRTLPAGFFIEFGAAITRAEWVNTSARVSATASVVEAPATPPIDEEYFEWLDLLEAVEHATDGAFVMVELGAGYGRWSVRGALAARAAGLEPHCVAVEAEPDHARWLRQHFHDNELQPDDHELLWAAVAPEGGFVPFRVGMAQAEYGQHIRKRTDLAYPDAAERRRLRARAVLGRPPRIAHDRSGSMWVPSIPIVEILAPYPVVDLLDIDIQGAELAALAAATHALNTRVRRVHVGTHARDIERGLRELFAHHGWQCLHDYACQSTSDTPYGAITFVDGVQSWTNPEVGDVERSGPTVAIDETELTRLSRRVRSLKEKVVRLTAERDELRLRISH
jgi:FkbM family methyltransferase